MTPMPNPFLISPLEPVMAGETAAAPDLTDPPDAAAEQFDYIPLSELRRRGFDLEDFMDAIEPAPLFLSDPRPEYLDAIPDAVLAVLAGY